VVGDVRSDNHEPVATHEAWQQAFDILRQLDHADAEPVRAKLRARSGAGLSRPGPAEAVAGAA
jgi:hypothetical protein